MSEDRRCYDYLIEQSAICQDKFVPVTDSDGSTHYKGDCWGFIEGDYLCIIKSVFDKICSDRGFSPKRFLNWAKAMNLILLDKQGKNTRPKRFGNKTIRCICLKMPNYDDEPEQITIDDLKNGVDF